MAKKFEKTKIRRQQQTTTVATQIQETNYTIDPEFEAFNPPLPPEQREELKASIQKQGFLDSVKYWTEPQSKKRLIIDGHNRLDIARELGIENRMTFEEVPGLDSREEVRIWIDTFQFGRRNYTAFQLSFVRGRLYENRKQRGFYQNDRNGQTAVQLAKEHNTSQATIARDAALYKALNDRVDPKLKQDILNENKAKVKKGDLVKIGQQPAKESQTIFSHQQEITDFLKQGKEAAKPTSSPKVKKPLANKFRFKFPTATPKAERLFPLYAKDKEAHYLLLSPKHCLILSTLESKLLDEQKSGSLYQRFLDESLEEITYSQFSKASDSFFLRLQKDIDKSKAWQDKTAIQYPYYLALTKGHWEISPDRIHYSAGTFDFDKSGYIPIELETIKEALQQALNFFAAALKAPQKPAKDYYGQLVKKLG